MNKLAFVNHPTILPLLRTAFVRHRSLKPNVCHDATADFTGLWYHNITAKITIHKAFESFQIV